MAEKVVVTMVFEVERDAFRSMNPLITETPWGIPTSISLGDIIEDADRMRKHMERISKASAPCLRPE